MPELDADAFTYSDGNLATVSSGKWTALSAFVDLVVASNEVVGSSTNDNIDVITSWSGDTGNQYSEVVGRVATSFPAGPTVHSDGSTTFYLLAITDGAYNIYKVTSGPTFNSLKSGSVTTTDGDTYRLRYVDGTLTFSRNGTDVDSVANSDIATGKPGVMVNGSSGMPITSWAAGDFGAPAPSTIWNLTEMTAAAIVDLLMVVDDPGGTPTSKKLALSDFVTLVTSNVVVQVKTVGSGTYTPTTGMKKVLGIAVGGGGGGNGGANTDSAGGGGGGGGTVIRLMTAADIGASKAYVVGAGGAAANNGTATTLDAAGALMNAGGGTAGTAGAQGGVLGVSALGGAGGTAANGDLNIPGTGGGIGVTYSGTEGQGGYGGSSVFGFGGKSAGVNLAGVVGTAYGGGGSGGHAAGAADRAGAAGADGILYLIEFLAA